MSIFDKFDKYELFAVIVPTMCCIFVCILASWPLIDWLKCAGFIECLPPIVKNALFSDYPNILLKLYGLGKIETNFLPRNISYMAILSEMKSLLIR